VLQGVHGDVGGEVIHPVHRLLGGDRVPLGRGDPDEQRTRQARTGGDGDRVDIREGHPGLGQRPLHGGHDRFQVGAAGHLGHHAAEPGVLRDAGGQRVGEQGVPADDTDAGLVAGGLDTEDQWFVSHARQSSLRCMTSASVLLGW
jgi:hypothetical protein